MRRSSRGCPGRPAHGSPQHPRPRAARTASRARARARPNPAPTSIRATAMSSSRRNAAHVTRSALRGKHTAEQRERARLVEVLVEVAALRALHARWAAVLARTAFEHARSVADPAFELLET